MSSLTLSELATEHVLESSPGQVKSLAWTGDGYCLAAGYKRGWAAWSMGGRLNGWGVQDEDESEDPGVVDLVR